MSVSVSVSAGDINSKSGDAMKTVDMFAAYQNYV